MTSTGAECRPRCTAPVHQGHQLWDVIPEHLSEQRRHSRDRAADRRLGHAIGLSQLCLDPVPAHICQRHGHRPEQSQDWRPVINSRFQFFRAYHRAQVSDLVPGESRAIIHTGGPLSSELSVVTQFFREADRFSRRHAVDSRFSSFAPGLNNPQCIRKGICILRVRTLLPLSARTRSFGVRLTLLAIAAPAATSRTSPFAGRRAWQMMAAWHRFRAMTGASTVRSQRGAASWSAWRARGLPVRVWRTPYGSAYRRMPTCQALLEGHRMAGHYGREAHPAASVPLSEAMSALLGECFHCFPENIPADAKPCEVWSGGLWVGGFLLEWQRGTHGWWKGLVNYRHEAGRCASPGQGCPSGDRAGRTRRRPQRRWLTTRSDARDSANPYPFAHDEPAA